MKIKIQFCAFALLLPTSGYSQVTSNLVPTDTVAIQIAKAVWVPIYGKKILEKTPFTATLQGDSVWIVEGSLPPVKKLKDGTMRVTYGGVPVAEIMKNDGKILSVYHTR